MFALWGFAVATAYVPGIYSAPYMPRYWAIAIGLALVAKLDLAAIDEKILWCIGVLLLWSGLTLLWSPALYGGGLSVALMALFCLCIVASAAMTAAQRSLLLRGFALGMAISAVVGLSQKYLGLNEIPQGAPPGGLFFNSEVLAETCAPIAVWCALQKDKIWWCVAGLLAVIVLASGERIGCAVLALGLIYGLVQHRGWRFALFTALAVAGALSLFLKAQSADQRIMYWGTALMSSSFAGSGVGWWFQAHPFPHEEYVHSDVLQSIVEIGLGSVALVAIGVLAWRGRGTRAERAMFLALVVETLVSFPLHMPATSFLLAVAAGGLCCRRSDIRVAGLSVRARDGLGVRWAAACARAVSFGGAGFRALVPVRSALAQHAGVDRAAGCGSV